MMTNAKMPDDASSFYYLLKKGYTRVEPNKEEIGTFKVLSCSLTTFPESVNACSDYCEDGSREDTSWRRV
ncbi:hypothetical protein R1flu_009877 [Riccia fluitans]|uniref:Uncharacterized protein n=1 Tax=Riccia fluitans TaxID=41844 RepID=A0ABD1Z457_9MARC